MGDIIHEFNIKELNIPTIYIKRHVDRHEEQTLTFHMDSEAKISTESGNSLTLFGRTTDGTTIEIMIPVSIDDLIEYLVEAQQ